MIPFGQWLPDQSDLNNPGSTVAQNVFPAARGYRPIGSLAEYSSETTTSTRPLNVAAFKDSSDAIQVYAGTASTLEHLGAGSGTLSDISRTGGYTAIPNWKFITFGNNVIAAGGTTIPLQINTLSQGGAANFKDLTDSPQAKYIATVKDFIVTAHTSSSNIGPFEVQWSEINPSLPEASGVRYWYDDGASGSAATGLVNQADSQTISDSGQITGIVGGEFGVVFMERAIARMQYVGSPLIFAFEKVETDRGCSFPGSIAAIGPAQAYFLSREGFFVFNGSNSQPIGAEQVDNYFFNDYDETKAERITSTIDPENTNVIWSYVSTSSPDGEPDKLLIYNYTTQSWSSASLSHQSITAVRTTNVSEAELTGNLDTEYSVSFDSGLYKGGAFLLGATKENKIWTFTGTPLDATLETAEVEPAPLKRTLVTSVTPYVTLKTGETAPTVTAQVLSRSKQTEAPTATAESTLNDANFCPTRSNGRYHRMRINITGEWRYALGVDITANQSGSR